jgi:hypothetical protein
MRGPGIIPAVYLGGWASMMGWPVRCMGCMRVVALDLEIESPETNPEWEKPPFFERRSPSL